MARPRADGWQGAPVPLYPVPGHPRPGPAPVHGQPGGQVHLHGQGDRACVGHRPHVRSPPGRARGRRRGPPDLRLCAEDAHLQLPAGHGRGPPGGAPDRPAVHGVVRARHGGRRAGRVWGGHGALPPCGRGHHGRALRLGRVRPALPPAELPVRRHGEPVPHLLHAHPPRRGLLPGGRGRPRDRPLVDGQPRHQRHVGALLAQRGVDRVAGEADPGEARQGA
mmetsp:Transcript_24061/g.80863  ORF Transcript_24061/g.80863 Transcript_24061/m.80863 type:complete len:222 (-) Transcript_24061:1010-1675(-)